MATLPRSAVDAYTRDLNALSDAARETVAAMLAGIEYDGVADLREQVTEVMESVCGAGADMAAARAAEFYDEARALQAGGRLGASADPRRNPAATEGAVRALVQAIAEGGPWERFASRLRDRADYEVKRAAGECVKANAARDPLRPRWARVPSGAETCGFCIMLASRGFVYSSDDEAGADGHYHPNCDCRIVPGFEGMEVEGYDPDALYRLWKDGEARSKGRKKVSFASDEVKRRVLPHELRTAERLAGLHDMSPRFVQDYKWVVGEDGVKRKVGLPDLDDGTELKAILESGNAHGALRNHLRSALKKHGLIRVIVDNTDSRFIADKDLLREARGLRDEYPGIPVLSLLLKSGELMDIQKEDGRQNHQS